MKMSIEVFMSFQMEEEHFARQQQGQQQPINAKQGFQKILEGHLHQIKEVEISVFTSL